MKNPTEAGTATTQPLKKAFRNEAVAEAYKEKYNRVINKLAEHIKMMRYKLDNYDSVLDVWTEPNECKIVKVELI